MSLDIFKRVEIKYMLSKKQYEIMLDKVNRYMKPDVYGKSTIQSLYYDTLDDLLVRRSIDKPFYKEKLRLRSYNIASMDDNVFLEIKKKYDGIVYKRRVSLKQKDVINFFNGEFKIDSQIGKEITYFKDYYKTLRPKTLLIYDREAYFLGDLRITFDHNIKYRCYDLTLDKGFYGKSLLNNDDVLMEIKVNGSMPFWLIQALEEAEAYKTSFSKYGTSYILEYRKENLSVKENELVWNNYSQAYLQAVHQF